MIYLYTYFLNVGACCASSSPHENVPPVTDMGTCVSTKIRIWFQNAHGMGTREEGREGGGESLHHVWNEHWQHGQGKPQDVEEGESNERFVSSQTLLWVIEIHQCIGHKRCQRNLYSEVTWQLNCLLFTQIITLAHEQVVEWMVCPSVICCYRCLCKN